MELKMNNPLLTTVHQHILSELKVNTKTDTTFVISSIFINVAILSTNSIIASTDYEDSIATKLIIMSLFVILLLVVNLVAEIGLIKGRQTRFKLISGLIKMYKDNEVDGYYDKSILDSYNTRYRLFMIVVLVTGLIALVVPIVIM